MTAKTYNDVAIPSIMYGTAWKKEATKKLTQLAVQAGFRAIDTANQLKHYDESLVGEALIEMAKSGITRDQLFLQTKYTSLDGQDHRLPYERSAPLSTQVKQSMDSSLIHLHTDIIDSFVLHGPFSRGKLTAGDWEVWDAIEQLYQDGKTRMIGVSNFGADQLQELCTKAKVKPMVVQNRCYASMGWDYDAREICREHEIVYQGFSLLTANGHELNSAPVRAIAQRLGATVAQTTFAFASQIGMVPLTGTTAEQHMKEDLQFDQFKLTEDEVQQFESLSFLRA